MKETDETLLLLFMRQFFRLKLSITVQFLINRLSIARTHNIAF